MAAPPVKTEISDTFPKPSNATMRIGMGKFWDYVTGLLGATGNAAEARVALGVIQATETVVGIAEVTTQAETDAGTDDARIVTSLKLRSGFAASFTTNGYVKVPSWLGGWVLQWGSVADGTAEGSSVAFPTTFPTALYAVIPVVNASLTGTAAVSAALDRAASTTSGMRVSRRYINNGPVLVANEGFTWIALGK